MNSVSDGHNDGTSEPETWGVVSLWPPDIWPRLCVFAVLVTTALVFMPQVRNHFHAPKAFALRLFVLLGLLTWWASRRQGRCFNNPFGPALGVWLLGCGLSMLAAPNIAESLDINGFIDNLVCYFLVFLVIQSFTTIRHLKQYIYIVLLSAILLSLYGCLQSFRLDPWRLVTNGVPVSTLGGPPYCTYYHELVFPLALAFLVYIILVPTRISVIQYGRMPLFPLRVRRYRYAAFTLTLLYIVIGGYHMLDCYRYSDRITLQVSLYTTLWMWILFWLLPRFLPLLPDDLATERAIRQRRSRYRRAGIALAILGFGAICWIYIQTPLAGTFWSKGHELFRLNVWHGTLQKISDNPLLGIGPGNFKVVHPLYESQRERTALGTEVLGRHADNDYLEQISEGGILAAAGLFWLSVLVVMLLWSNLAGLEQIQDLLERSKTPPERTEELRHFHLFNFWLALGLAGSIIGIGFHSFLETPMLLPASKVLWTTLLGVIAVQRRLIRRAEFFAESPWETPIESVVDGTEISSTGINEAITSSPEILPLHD